MADGSRAKGVRTGTLSASIIGRFLGCGPSLPRLCVKGEELGGTMANAPLKDWEFLEDAGRSQLDELSAEVAPVDLGAEESLVKTPDCGEGEGVGKQPEESRWCRSLARGQRELVGGAAEEMPREDPSRDGVVEDLGPKASIGGLDDRSVIIK